MFEWLKSPKDSAMHSQKTFTSRLVYLYNDDWQKWENAESFTKPWKSFSLRTEEIHINDTESNTINSPYETSVRV